MTCFLMKKDLYNYFRFTQKKYLVGENNVEFVFSIVLENYSTSQTVQRSNAANLHYTMGQRCGYDKHRSNAANLHDTMGQGSTVWLRHLVSVRP